MSVLKQVYATPSRVKGVYRFLLHTKEQKMNRAQLEQSISPLSIQKENDDKYFDMVRDAIDEMIAMKILDEEDSVVSLSKQLPSELRDREKGDELFPFYILSLFVSKENDENYDIVRLLAWYLAQDLHDAPGTWEQFEEQLNKQIGQNKLECTNSSKYGQVEDWFVFCRMAVMYSVKGVTKRLAPDPTLYIEWMLPKVFHDTNTLTLPIMMERIKEMMPVLDKGTFRNMLNDTYKIERSSDNYVSSVTSYSLLRLHDEGIIELNKKSDADTMILIDSGAELRYSHVIYKGTKEWTI